MIKKKLLGLKDNDQIPDYLMDGLWATPGSFTMIGYKRLENIRVLIENVLRDNIPGDLIEAGVWRGGAVIYMKYVLNEYGSKKKVFVADSFCGLPKPENKYEADKNDCHYQIDFLRVSADEVRENFESFGLMDKRIIFVKGWFSHTLPKLKERFCIIRLDGDMYGSTMEALENLYHKLSIGGYVIIDDYILPNCEKAVKDFRSKYGITEEMTVIDESGRYWQKK